MNPVSPIPAIAIALTGSATAWALATWRRSAPEPGRHASIDGLRGYLALSVFLHHGCIWFFHLRTGRWETPPSNLYVHLGQTSVALFFMITAFLFVTKVLDASQRPIDWLRLYVGRVMRLTPLYLLAMALLFAVVAWRSGGQLQEPPADLLRHATEWLLFSVGGTQDLNGVRDTLVIVAGVTWSLPYEWFFYLCLPLLALATGRRPPLAAHLAGLLALLFLLVWHPHAMQMSAFLGGVLAALCVRSPGLRERASRPAASLLVIALLAVAVARFPGAYQAVPMLLVSLAFCLIAAGSSLFGLLTCRTSRVLGEMTYSLYLLHGLLLYALFEGVLGAERAAGLSATQHWLMVLVLCPVLILLSQLAYRMVEQPGLALTGPATRWLRLRLSGRRTATG
ncbi:acyltransferase family protein [Leptothrix sp. BB-4]